jgi:hypothetical protein
VIEKNIEVRIGRRFKRQGPSWTRRGAEHLAQLLWLQAHPTDWDPLVAQNSFKQNTSKPPLGLHAPPPTN